MKKYRTKIGLELIGFIFIVFIFMGFISADYWTAMLITIIFVAIIFVFALKGMAYKINDTVLTVQGSLMPDIKIEIDSIRKIVETNNPLSSPAGSLDRIEIFYNKFDSVIISPVETEEFLARLIKINPDIEVKRMTTKNFFSKLAV